MAKSQRQGCSHQVHHRARCARHSDHHGSGSSRSGLRHRLRPCAGPLLSDGSVATPRGRRADRTVRRRRGAAGCEGAGIRLSQRRPPGVGCRPRRSNARSLEAYARGVNAGLVEPAAAGRSSIGCCAQDPAMAAGGHDPGRARHVVGPAIWRTCAASSCGGRSTSGSAGPVTLYRLETRELFPVADRTPPGMPRTNRQRQARSGTDGLRNHSFA